MSDHKRAEILNFEIVQLAATDTAIGWFKT